MQAEPLILVIEDDARIRRELLDALRAEGYGVQVSVSFRDASKAIQRKHDLVLLDLGLPGGDGMELCKTLRQSEHGVPIIILTARDTPEQRVLGLEMGADDYVVKPFHMPELLARVRGILRRSGRTAGAGLVRCGELWVDPPERRAGRGELSFALKPRGYELLLFLLRNPGRARPRDQLLDRVWGDSYEGDMRTVDLHVRRLRKQIEEDAGDPFYLQTVWGVGYRMRDGA